MVFNYYKYAQEKLNDQSVPDIEEEQIAFPQEKNELPQAETPKEILPEVTPDINQITAQAALQTANEFKETLVNMGLDALPYDMLNDIVKQVINETKNKLGI